MMRKEKFLKDRKGGTSNHHKEYLGMDIPDNYFADSKASIMDLVSEEKTRPHQVERSSKKEVPVFYLRRSFQIAASITLLIALTIGYQFLQTSESATFEVASDDVLIESLFVEEGSMNDFVESILVSEVVIEAEKSEQDLENIFINSLFVEDSLIDDYTKKSFMDNIIL